LKSSAHSPLNQKAAITVHPVLPSAYFESVSTLKGLLLVQRE
jgi:hypothetical protein